MQTLLLPAGSSGFCSAAIPSVMTYGASAPNLHRLALRSLIPILSPSNSHFSLRTSHSLNDTGKKLIFTSIRASSSSSTPISPTFTAPNDESEKAKLTQVILYYFVLYLLVLLFSFWENSLMRKNLSIFEYLRTFIELSSIFRNIIMLLSPRRLYIFAMRSKNRDFLSQTVRF